MYGLLPLHDNCPNRVPREDAQLLLFRYAGFCPACLFPGEVRLDARCDLRRDRAPYRAFGARLRLCDDGIDDIIPDVARCALRGCVWRRGSHRPKKYIRARYETPRDTEALYASTGCGFLFCSARERVGVGVGSASSIEMYELRNC